MKLDVGSTLRCARWEVRRTVTVTTSVYTAPKQRVLAEGVWALISSIERRYGCIERAKLSLRGIIRCGCTLCGATKTFIVGRFREVVRLDAMKDKDNDHFHPSKVENRSETALLSERRRRYGGVRESGTNATRSDQ